MQLPKQFKRKQQAGFIQNFIIPGIILIGVVIAGIAMLASNSGGSDTSNEKAAMMANSVMGSGLTVSGAVQRALADGAAMPKGFLTNENSVLVAGKYLTAMPSLPQGVVSGGIYYSTGDLDVIDGLDTNIGGPGNIPADKDDVVLVDLGTNAAAEQTCRRINNKTAGVSVNATDNLALVADTHIRFQAQVGGVAEGCGHSTDGVFGSGVHYVYYKVVNAKGNASAPAGGSGGSPAP